MSEKGREIRTRLFLLDLTQVWLIERLREKGIYTDKTEMCSVLKGTRVGKKADTILKTSIEILDEYGKDHKSNVTEFLPGFIKTCSKTS